MKTIKRSCAAVLLAGWYLVAPPMYESYNSKHKLLSTRAYVNAPLPAWTNFRHLPDTGKVRSAKAQRL